MSIRLLLENFLGLMKEEGELDVFLPMLMTSMGHEIIFYAQKGARQYGVDVISKGKDPEDGKEKLCLWLIKCGNIGRTEWSSGPQAIRQSIEEIGDVFLPTHVLPQHKRLRKKLIVLTNGDYQSTTMLDLSQYLKNWGPKYSCETTVMSGSTLAIWTEKYLLDEHILPAAQRTLFRRTLVNVANPELCVPVGRQLIQKIFATIRGEQKSLARQQKNKVGAFRAARTALAVIFQWSQNEGSLESARQLSEYAILEAWTWIQQDFVGDGNRPIIDEFMQLYSHFLVVGQAYTIKIAPYLVLENALAFVSGDALVTTDLAFREIGQLGLQGLMWAFIAIESEGDVSQLALQYAQGCSALISKTLITHGCASSPAFDNQVLDIHSALLCLMVTKKTEDAVAWLTSIVLRLDLISQSDMKYWPMNAEFEDVLEVRNNPNYPKEEFINVSTLIPVLLLWCATLKMGEAYAVIKSRIMPRLSNTTLNVWSADEKFDGLVNDPAALHASGFGEALSEIPDEPEDFIKLLATSSEEIPSIEESTWFKARAAFIPLLAARHWRLQISKHMLVQHVLAFK